jgi:SAM-dependent methyltransferase
MLAIQGDLNDLQDLLTQPEWSNFDAAIISMALHHVQNPADLLKRLCQRVKRGGSIVVIDWLQQSGRDASANTEEGRMTRLSEGPKIWPGFSVEDIEKYFKAAECNEVDVVVYFEPIDVPSEMEGYGRMFIAKGRVASRDAE